MNLRKNMAWIMAMDELQGDIPDPSSFRPDEYGDGEEASACGVARGNASGAAMYAAPSAPATRTSVRGSSRSGTGGGSMSC